MPAGVQRRCSVRCTEHMNILRADLVLLHRGTSGIRLELEQGLLLGSARQSASSRLADSVRVQTKAVLMSALATR